MQIETIEQSVYFIDQQKVPAKKTAIFQELTGTTVYEIIRIQEGVPLFLEDHLERLRVSAKTVDCPLKDSDEVIKQRIYALIALNQTENQNIKIIWGQPVNVLLLFFTKSSYPPASAYQIGIHTTLMKLERQDPNIKLQKPDYQKKVLNERREKGVFEVLLTDKNDTITEGSRSNLFFVEKGALYTPPIENVLPGVIRKKVFDICQQQNIPIQEKALAVKQLPTLDGVFITGTSNNILPVRSIGDLTLKSTNDPVIQKLMAAFEQLINDYIHRDKELLS